MGALQPWHLIVILTIVLLVFGPGKLPELGRAVGDGLRELKRSTAGEAERSCAPLASSTTTATGETCPRCQAPVAGTARFCGACGAPLAATSSAR